MSTPNVCESVVSAATAFEFNFNERYTQTYTSTAKVSSVVSYSTSTDTYLRSSTMFLSTEKLQIQPVWIETQQQPLDPQSSTVPTTGTGTAHPTASTPAEVQGLSTRAKVGLAVGVLAFTILLFCGALLYWRRKRKVEPARVPVNEEWDKPELDGNGASPHEMEASRMFPIRQEPVEML